MRNILKAHRFAKIWLAALDFASVNEFEESLVELARLYKLLNLTMPSEKITIEANILLSIVSCRLGNFEVAIKSANAALLQLRREGLKFGSDNVSYLNKYCIDIINYCQGSEKKIPSEKYPQLMPFQIDKVRSDLKRNFPIFTEGF